MAAEGVAERGRRPSAAPNEIMGGGEDGQRLLKPLGPEQGESSWQEKGGRASLGSRFHPRGKGTSEKQDAGSQKALALVLLRAITALGGAEKKISLHV